jgi:FMN phosphatase YigB (HAD superfamily)
MGAVNDNNLEDKSLSRFMDTIHRYAELQVLIRRARVVSFDFFDTLFVRPLENPEDVFNILGNKLSIPDFRERRKAAQSEAFRRMHVRGRKEITLVDIYDCFGEGLISVDDLVKEESAVEWNLLEPNAEIFDLLSFLVKGGKSVVITSDMYLPTVFFEKILQRYGIEGVPLFVSADCNATKRDSGELFDVVLERLGCSADEVLHIGDNMQADVVRPREKGMMAFHYLARCETNRKKTVSLTSSIGQGLLRTSGRDIPPNSYTELGFIYGGAANFGYFQWIKERCRLDDIDHVLFLSRDGYALDRIARAQNDGEFPKSCYFLGSRTAYTLAAINANNFTQFIPFLLSGADGLSPCELLERIGVQPPSSKVMEDLGLGQDIRVGDLLYEKLGIFLYAYRWEILKICQRNRRALYAYLKRLGICSGNKLALVDVGWSGTTQEAFELAVRPLMDLDVTGYYFCLADTPERFRREKTQHMSAMVNTKNTSTETIASIYANRVVVELFFSAPHHSVIGLQPGTKEIEPVLDPGRGDTDHLLNIAKEVSYGIERFAESYSALQKRLGLSVSPVDVVWPMIELVTEKDGYAYQLLHDIAGFDAWGSSRNRELKLADY